MISVGYVLLEGMPRKGWMHPSVPETVFSPTPCVCVLHPVSDALTYLEKTDEQRAYLEKLKLESETFTNFLSDVEKLFDESLWGLDGVFADRKAALDFQHTWFRGDTNVRLFELSLPVNLLPEFLEAVAPPMLNAVPSGKYLAAQRAGSAVVGTDVLGFEVWGVQEWGEMHTSVCYGVRDDFISALGIEFNDLGLLNSLDLAHRGADLKNLEDGGSVGDCR